MQNFIAEMKNRLRNEGVEASYLCITNNMRDGIRIGDSLVFFETKGNQYIVRIFAPKEVPIRRIPDESLSES
jgi:hypothetical protein